MGTLNTAEMKSTESLVATWVLGQMELQSGIRIGRACSLGEFWNWTRYFIRSISILAGEHTLNNRAEARRWFEAAYAYRRAIRKRCTWPNAFASPGTRGSGTALSDSGPARRIRPA